MAGVPGAMEGLCPKAAYAWAHPGYRGSFFLDFMVLFNYWKLIQKAKRR